uniref:Uncharacterized protein n=1 Tax=Fagus sylvatica TaxID=28930 RepID=A0A2N9H5G2_FAGSY
MRPQATVQIKNATLGGALTRQMLFQGNLTPPPINQGIIKRTGGKSPVLAQLPTQAIRSRIRSSNRNIMRMEELEKLLYQINLPIIKVPHKGNISLPNSSLESGLVTALAIVASLLEEQVNKLGNKAIKEVSLHHLSFQKLT